MSKSSSPSNTSKITRYSMDYPSLRFASNMKEADQEGNTITFCIDLAELCEHRYPTLIEAIQKPKATINISIFEMDKIVTLPNWFKDFLSNIPSTVKEVWINDLELVNKELSNQIFETFLELKCRTLKISAKEVDHNILGTNLCNLIAKSQHISKLDISPFGDLISKSIPMQESIIKGCNANPKLRIKHSKDLTEDVSLKLLHDLAAARVEQHTSDCVDFLSNNLLSTESEDRVLRLFPTLDTRCIPRGDKISQNEIEQCLAETPTILGGLADSDAI